MTGTLWRDHAHVDVGRRRDVAEADVEPVREENRVTVFDVGLDRLRVNLALGRVGREHHHEVSLRAGVERRQDAKSLGLGGSTRLGRLGQTDAYVDTGVA